MSYKKTSEMKLLEGNRGHRPLDLSTDVAYQVGAPTIPYDMKGDARKHWRWLESVLIPARVLTPADAGLMALTCNAFAYLKRLEREGRKRKTIVYSVTGSTGQTIEKRHKEFDLLDQAERKYLRLLQEFGLTPVSRNRVKLAKLPVRSGIEEFFGTKPT